MSAKSILLVGHGKMGGAIAKRWLENSDNQLLNYQINIIDRHLSRSEYDGNDDVTIYSSLANLPSNVAPDVIMLAVKPQAMADILPEYAKIFGIKPLYISIAAGKNIAFFKGYLGDDARIIRAMPNTPAIIGEAITALVASNNTSDNDKNIASILLTAIGEIIWLDSENEIDIVTAISGSGPAYLFHFMECLINAATQNNISESVAKALVTQTIFGSAKLALNDDSDIKTLRKNVTSKGGTTEAALGEFMKNDALQKLTNEAIGSAIKKAKELSG